MHRLWFAVGASALAFLVVCADDDDGAERRNPPAATTNVSVAGGGSVTSADGGFQITIGPGVLVSDAIVLITEDVPSPAPAATLGKVYDVTISPLGAVPAQGFTAGLTFRLPPATLASAAPQDVRVASGPQVGQPLDDVFPANVDTATGVVTATVDHLSYFFVLDGLVFTDCTCDTDATCQAGCEFCDDDCVTGAGPGDSVYPACTTDVDCGIGGFCADGFCVQLCATTAPACPEGYECVGDACFKSCTGADGCGDTDCCIEGMCVPADFCPPDVPDDWTCNPFFFGTDDGCDCGCGIPDPDCSGAGCSAAGCTAAGCDFCYDAGGMRISCDGG